VKNEIHDQDVITLIIHKNRNICKPLLQICIIKKELVLRFLPDKITHIVDKQAKVVYKFKSQMQAEKHVEKALEILEKIK